mgnify:CR=1 FL=1
MEIPQDLKEVLEPGERILWSGKPSRIPFTLKSAWFSLLGLPLLAFPLILLRPVLLKVILDPPVLLFLIFWYGILGFVFLGAPIYALLVWRNMFYVLTDKRVVVRKGLVGIDYDILGLDMIQQVNVEVGFWDKLYQTGSLVLQAIGVTPLKLYCVRDPRKVQAIISKAIEAKRKP